MDYCLQIQIMTTAPKPRQLTTDNLPIVTAAPKQLQTIDYKLNPSTASVSHSGFAGAKNRYLNWLASSRA